MKGSKKQAQPTMPTASQLAPMLELQSRYARTNVETPFGAQRYVTDPRTGMATLRTELSPGGAALVNRAMGLGMVDSDQVAIPGQVNDIAGALANRIGGRFGLRPAKAGQFQLGSAKPSGAMGAMPAGKNLGNY